MQRSTKLKGRTKNINSACNFILSPCFKQTFVLKQTKEKHSQTLQKQFFIGVNIDFDKFFIDKKRTILSKVFYVQATGKNFNRNFKNKICFLNSNL